MYSRFFLSSTLFSNLETKKYVYIFEFKLNGSADEAMKQIEDKGYATPYLTDSRIVVCIGVDFSSATGTVEGWKEVILAK